VRGFRVTKTEEIAPGGSLAYVTNEGSNDLSVVDLDSLSVVATVPVGNAPRKIVVQAAAAAALSGPAGTAALSAPAAGTATGIAGFAFADTLRIRAGQTITWTNNDPVPHTVTSDDGQWDSGDIATGRSFSRRFEMPGTHAYHCGNHPAMQGTIVVSAAMEGSLCAKPSSPGFPWPLKPPLGQTARWRMRSPRRHDDRTPRG